MTIDYKNILAASMHAETQRSKLIITREKLTAETQRMAAAGYDFQGEDDIKLLETYLSSQSGLMLSGGVGSGKTFFFKAVGLPILSMQQAAKHTLSDIVAALESRRDEDIVIDDVGAESEFNHYGVKIDLMNLIIESRLTTFARTHFTTNLTSDQLYARYGARVFDRMKELARLVQIKGSSRRRADGPRIIAEDAFLPRLWQECAARCRFYDDGRHTCIKRITREPREVEMCPYF